IGAALAVAILSFQIRYRIIQPGEIKANIRAIVWPYIVLACVFLIYYFLHAPKILDRNRQAALDLLEEEVKDLKSELEAKDEEATIGIEVRDCRLHARLFGHFGAAVRNGSLDDPVLPVDVFVHVWVVSSFLHQRGIKEYCLEVTDASGEVVSTPWLPNTVGAYHKDSKEEVPDTWGQVIEERRRDPLKELGTDSLQYSVPMEGWLHFLLEKVKLSEARFNKLTIILKDSMGLCYCGYYDKPRAIAGDVWPNKIDLML
ncbi:MAG: hypothetical protein WA578_09975, partial [Candidatus Sulfotelmatobacter sp.]